MHLFLNHQERVPSMVADKCVIFPPVGRENLAHRKMPFQHESLQLRFSSTRSAITYLVVQTDSHSKPQECFVCLKKKYKAER